MSTRDWIGFPAKANKSAVTHPLIVNHPELATDACAESQKHDSPLHPILGGCSWR
jgi:hypothetical protein